MCTFIYAGEALSVNMRESNLVQDTLFAPRALLAVALALMMVTSGCLGFGDEEDEKPEPDTGPLTPPNTYYHFAGGVVADNSSANLSGDNVIFMANGTYYGFGTTTFEPTIGTTSTGAIFMSNYGGAGRGTHIIRSQDQGQTWEDMGPFFQLVPNSNDPYIYVDPWTDQIIKFDMHALTGMTFSISDDEGESWTIETFTTGYTPQDHQTIASMPPPPGFSLPVFHDTLLVYCINTGLQGGVVGGAYCSVSRDNGLTWDGERPGYEVGVSPCSGLTGHNVGANDGTIYRGNPSCDGPAVYRSLDGGYTWTEHTITTELGSQSHEIAAGTDEANNLHAFWIGDDNLPYYSNSQDRGDTWREPLMVAPPGVTGTGFPTIAGGADGRAVFGYIGQHGEGTWNGYMGVVTDGFAERPLITTVAVNSPEDPLDETGDCGYRRCGGFGDFIDVTIDPEGRPWVAMTHNPGGEIGIVGTYTVGPALRGELRLLTELPEGGPGTL